MWVSSLLDVMGLESREEFGRLPSYKYRLTESVEEIMQVLRSRYINDQSSDSNWMMPAQWACTLKSSTSYCSLKKYCRKSSSYKDCLGARSVNFSSMELRKECAGLWVALSFWARQRNLSNFHFALRQPWRPGFDGVRMPCAGCTRHRRVSARARQTHVEATTRWHKLQSFANVCTIHMLENSLWGKSL